MASKVLGLLCFLWINFRKDTDVLLVKGTLHTGMKETHAKTTMTILASSDVGRLKKSLKKKTMTEKLMIQPLFISKSRDVF